MRLPLIDRYTCRAPGDSAFLALIAAYETKALSFTDSDRSKAHDFLAKANWLAREGFGDSGSWELLTVLAANYYDLALVSSGAEEKVCLEMAELAFTLLTENDPDDEDAAEILEQIKERRRIRADILGEIGSTDYAALLSEHTGTWAAGLEACGLLEDAAAALRLSRAETRRIAEREKTGADQAPDG